jgi:UDP-2,4-diacetamido-2,4,6-trideoxy-beta-L-altropyranose hydrolase
VKRAVFIRADANREIGWGHLIRTAALAEALAARRCRITYYVRNSDPAAVAFLRRRFPVIRLDRELAEGPPAPGTWLILDQYGWTLAAQSALRRAGWKLLLVDDAPRGRFHADLVLNPSLNRCRYAADRGTPILAGRPYALLRAEFRGKRPAPRSRTPVARNILVSFGGGDRRGLGERICRILSHALPGVRLKLVAGPSASSVRVGASTTLLKSATAAEMRRAMEWSDLAVVSPSSTVWELCYLGVPAAVLGFAENQRPVARELRREDLALSLGWHDRIDDARLARRLCALAEDPARRDALSRNGRKAVDGRGVLRVIKAMGL